MDNFLEMSNHFVAGILLIMTDVCALLGKKKKLGVILTIGGGLWLFCTFYFWQDTEYNIGFLSRGLIFVDLIINYTLFRKIPYSKIFLIIFLLIGLLNLFIYGEIGYILLYLLLLSTIFIFIILLVLYLKKRKNGRNLEEKERKILKFFSEKFPEDEFYFSENLENVEDITKVVILTGVLSSKNLLANGVKGILLEIVENNDLKMYAERFEEFLSKKEYKDIITDEWGIKSLKRKLDKKSFRVVIGILVAYGIMLIGIIALIIIITILEEGYYL